MAPVPPQRHRRSRESGGRPVLAVVAVAVVVALAGLAVMLRPGGKSKPAAVVGTAGPGDAAVRSAGSGALSPSGSTPVSAPPSTSSVPSPTTVHTTSPTAVVVGATDLGGCQVAPADSIWRTPVDQLPVTARSAAYVASIGASSHVHADFGSGIWDGGPIGIPVTVIPSGTPNSSVSFDYPDESDKGPYPIPANALIEGGAQARGDRHVIAVDEAHCRDYELYDARSEGAGAWHAGSGAVFDLRSDALRPAGWTSADAAGLPVLPGLVRYDEASSGVIDHALRITVPRSQEAYLWPARHQASSDTDPALPPMGLRLRLKASVDISHLSGPAKAVAQALKTYGAIVADNGSAWYVSGTQDQRWNNDMLHELDFLTGGDFEAVDVSGLRESANSGAARKP